MAKNGQRSFSILKDCMKKLLLVVVLVLQAQASLHGMQLEGGSAAGVVEVAKGVAGLSVETGDELSESSSDEPSGDSGSEHKTPKNITSISDAKTPEQFCKLLETMLHDRDADLTSESLAAWIKQRGIDVNKIVDAKGSTPLHHAAMYCSQHIINAIILAGGKVNGQDGLGNTPLHGAASFARSDICALLLQHKADVTILNKMGRNALAVGALHDSSGTCLVLVKAFFKMGDIVLS